MRNWGWKDPIAGANKTGRWRSTDKLSMNVHYYFNRGSSSGKFFRESTPRSLRKKIKICIGFLKGPGTVSASGTAGFPLQLHQTSLSSSPFCFFQVSMSFRWGLLARWWMLWPFRAASIFTATTQDFFTHIASMLCHVCSIFVMLDFGLSCRS